MRIQYRNNSDNTAKSKIFTSSFLPITYPVVKVRRTQESASHDGHDRGRSAAQRSAGQWPATSGKDTDQGLDAGHEIPLGRVMGFRGWDPSCSVCDRRWDGDGGDEETRTPDPLLAKEMLYQLSYVPAPGGEWWAILDSNQRPLPYQGSALTS